MLHTPNRSLSSQNEENEMMDRSVLSGSRGSLVDSLRHFFSGLKIFRICLTLLLAGIVLIEVKILAETTKTYNESLVSQMISKNEALQAYLKNVTEANAETRELIRDILKTNQENQLEALHSADVTDEKLEVIQAAVTKLMEDNKLMYQEAEGRLNENLKLVKDALTMNTKTVISLLDDNNAVRAQFLRSSSSRDRDREWEAEREKEVTRSESQQSPAGMNNLLIFQPVELLCHKFFNV
jgi:hypothetical protein